MFELADHVTYVSPTDGEDKDQAAQTARCICDRVRCTQTLVYIMHMAKTDQAARMCSSCCRNTYAQPYQDTHLYARIKEYHRTMRSLNGANRDCLLDNRMVISESFKF